MHCRPWCAQVEDVLQLSEELALAELPDDFQATNRATNPNPNPNPNPNRNPNPNPNQATALRELEQEACTQLAELLQSVLRLDG